MTVELAICSSGKSVVCRTRMHLVGHNKDVLTFSRWMSGNDWALILHALAYLWHHFGLVLHLLLNLLRCLLCEFDGVCVCRLTCWQSDELLPLFLRVVFG